MVHVYNSQRRHEKHEDSKIIIKLNKTHWSNTSPACSLYTCALVHAVRTDKTKKVQEKDTTQLKLLEGEGRANPWLSTPLSLQTSEPFANPPPPPPPISTSPSLFIGTPRCLCFHLNPWQTACVWQCSNGFQGDSKSNVPRCRGIQCVTPHFCSQAQANDSSIQQASTWTCVYIISGKRNCGSWHHLLMCL